MRQISRPQFFHEAMGDGGALTEVNVQVAGE
jgi:hypothetical protein